MLSAMEHANMALYILKNDIHRPLVNGKANRDNIEEAITLGLYNDQLPPLTQTDVDIVCGTIDMAIEEYGSKA